MSGSALDAITALPVVDLAPLLGGAPDGVSTVARDLDTAFRQVGFCYITGHGVADSVIAAAFDASRRFHDLPLSEKQAIAINRWHRGYMALATSQIVTSRVAEATHPNQSESFMMMHELAPDDPDVVAGRPLAGPNQWPEGVAGFREATLAYEAALRAVCRRLTAALALALELKSDGLDGAFDRPVTFLRMLHYPPMPPSAPEGAYGSTPHTDYGFITLLAQDDRGGLEVQLEDGQWLPATPRPRTFVMNIGDMTERWSNGRWRATRHRVINRGGHDRYSIPYFYDMSLDTVVSPLVQPPAKTLPDSPDAYPPVSYERYLMERLDANYEYRDHSRGPTA